MRESLIWGTFRAADFDLRPEHLVRFQFFCMSIGFTVSQINFNHDSYVVKYGSNVGVLLSPQRTNDPNLGRLTRIFLIFLVALIICKGSIF